MAQETLPNEATNPSTVPDNFGPSTLIKPDVDSKLPDFIRDLMPSIVRVTRVEQTDPAGAESARPAPLSQVGIVVDSRGYIAIPVLAGPAKFYVVRFANQQEAMGELVAIDDSLKIGVDGALKLGVLKIENPLPVEAILNSASREVRPDERVLLVPSTSSEKVSVGRIQAIAAELSEGSTRLIQVDIACSLSDFGTLMVSEAGEPIGLILSSSRSGSKSMSFALPMKAIQPVLQAAIDKPKNVPLVRVTQSQPVTDQTRPVQPPAANSKMPDISGRWSISKDDRATREILVRRTQSESADFEYVGAFETMRFKWSPEARQFEGTISTTGPDSISKITIQPSSDLKLLRVAIALSDQAKEHLRRSQADGKSIDTLSQLWTRVELQSELTATAATGEISHASALPETLATKQLVERLKEQESAAASVANEIRRLQENGDAVVTIAPHQAQLKTHLQTAFDLKMQLEELQVKELQARLSRLERQIGQRKELREKIIARRAAELISGDSLQWNTTGSNVGLGTKNAIESQVLPSENYLKDNVQYFPVGPEKKQTNESAALDHDWENLMKKIRPQDWGAPNQGLRLAVVPVSENSPADKTLDVLVVAKNESQRDITFKDSGWYGNIGCTIRLTSGAQVGTQPMVKSGSFRPRSMMLAAGQSMVIGVRRIRVTDRVASNENSATDENHADVIIVDPKVFEFRNAIYTISCDLRTELSDQEGQTIPLHSGTVAIAFSRPSSDNSSVIVPTPQKPIDANLSSLSPSIEAIATFLDARAAAIKNMSVTTDYKKRHVYGLPFDAPIELTLVTKTIIDSEGRMRVETTGQQINIEPDGKSARAYKGRWETVFQNGEARSLTWYEANPPTASIDSTPSLHGIHPREFTTHFQSKSVSEIIRTSSAEIAERVMWDDRPVTIVQTTPIQNANDARRYRFWIDQERNVVVRRAIAIRFAEGQPWQEYARIENHDYQEIAPGIWLPSKVKYESLEVTPELTPAKLSWSYEGTNRDWKVNSDLPVDTFELAFPEGTFVNDHRAPDIEALAATADIKSLQEREMNSLQGTWCFDVLQSSTWPKPIGLPTDSSGRKSEQRWIISGDRITWTSLDGEHIDVSFTIDPTKTPKQIDFTFLSGPQKGKKSIGIYEPQKGNANYLWLCMTDPGTDAPRPTEVGYSSEKQQSMIGIYLIDKPNSLERFQGEWKMTLCDSTHKGFGASQEVVSKWSWVIRGDEILWNRDDDMWKLKLDVDSSKSPGELDLTYLTGPFKGSKCLGMFQWGGVDKTQLVIAVQDPYSDAPRPTKFSMDTNIRTGLMILEPRSSNR